MSAKTEIPRGSLRFKRLSLQEGLSQVYISHIFQDRSGFVWIGTENGLNRYDGYELRVFRWQPNNPESLSANHIERMAEDAEGRLWVLTRMGLDVLDPVSGKVRRIRNIALAEEENTMILAPVMALDQAGILWFSFGIDLEYVDTKTMTLGVAPRMGSKNIRAIFLDSVGDLWTVREEEGVSRFDQLKRQWIHYPIDRENPQSLAGNRGISYFEDRDGQVWFGIKGGFIHRLNADRKTFTRFQVRPELAEGNQHTIRIWHQDQQGRLWLTLVGNKELRLFDPETESLLPIPHQDRYAEDLGRLEVHVIRKGKTGQLWIGTYGDGLYLIDFNSARMVKYTYDPRDPEGIGGNMVTGIFQDPSGVFWITTGNGVDLLDERQTRFTRYDVRQLVEYNMREAHVRALWKDREDIIWVGTLRGLKRIDRQRGTVESWPSVEETSPFDKQAVGAILETREGRLIVGTWGGDILEADRANRRLIPLGRAPNEGWTMIYRIIQDSQGDLWFCTLGAGLVRWRLDEGLLHNYRHVPGEPDSLPLDEVFTALETPDGNLWVGTHGGGLGLWQRQADRFSVFRHQTDVPYSISSDDIRALHLSERGDLWIGTQGGGLNRYVPEEGGFERITVDDGLPNNTVYGILEDNHGTLWLSTNKGIANVDPVSRQIRRYDREDGLQHDEFNTGAFFRNRRGELMFGGVLGFNVFVPDTIINNTYIPPVHVTRAFVMNQETQLPWQKTRFSHTQNTFAFEFAALSYAQNHKNRYAYKLEGADRDWVNAGDRRYVSYTDLGPGEYTFRVRASNNDGIWNEEGTALAWSIKPPFWKTPLFLVSVLLMIPICIVLAFRWRVRQIKLRNQILKTMVQKRTQELERAKSNAEAANELKGRFLAKMTHEIRTPLNAILGFAEVLKSVDSLTEEQHQYLDLIHHSGDTLLQLLNDVLDLNKIEENKFAIESVPFPFRTHINQRLQPFLQKAESLGLRTRIDVDPAIPELVAGDPVRIAQVAVNLVANAIKFTSEGGIAVRFDHLQQTEQGLLVRGEISDTGIGIPAAMHDQIFARFAQADDSITRKYGGSGLGLAIVREVVTLLGGEVQVVSPNPAPPFSAGGPGTQFWFTFVLGRAKKMVPEETPPTGPPLPEGLCVLVAEDNPVNQKLVVKMLDQLGVRPHLVSDGSQAVEAVRQQEFDAVLMDVQMPVMDGYEASKRIKAMQPQLPVIGLSADVHKASVEKGLASGMDDYLGKPIKREQIRNKLSEWCIAKISSPQN